GAGPLFDIASVPATIVNWAGDEPASHREMCAYMAGLAGVTESYVESPVTMDAFIADNTRRRELIGPCRSNWRDALRTVYETRFAESGGTSDSIRDRVAALASHASGAEAP